MIPLHSFLLANVNVWLEMILTKFSVYCMASNLLWIKRGQKYVGQVWVRWAHLKSEMVSPSVNGHIESSSYQILRRHITSMQKTSIWSEPCCHLSCKPFLSSLLIFQYRCQTQLGKSTISIYHQCKYKTKSMLGLQYIKLLSSLITAPSNILSLENTLCCWKGNRNLALDNVIPKGKEQVFLTVVYVTVASAS